MTTVLYHANCPDGFTAAWLVHRALSPDGPVKLVPVNYGQPFPDPYPDDRGEDIYIVDFSYPPETIFAACEAMEGMVHLWDHHKAAIDQWAGITDLPSNLDLNLNVTLSGAGITYEELWGLARFEPHIYDFVSRVQDRDLWNFAYPDTPAVMASVLSRPYTIDAWELMAEIRIEQLAVEGRHIERYRQQLVASALERVQWATIAGHVVPVSNVSYEIGSDVASALLDAYPDAPFAGYYLDHPGQRQWGLRSTDDRLDVNEIAKAYGGGGHRNASGFRGHAGLIGIVGLDRSI